jgi:hypothetical protein
MNFNQIHPISKQNPNIYLVFSESKTPGSLGIPVIEEMIGSADR